MSHDNQTLLGVNKRLVSFGLRTPVPPATGATAHTREVDRYLSPVYATDEADADYYDYTNFTLLHT